MLPHAMTVFDTQPMEQVELSPGGPRLSRIVAGAWRLAAWNWSVQERLRWIEALREAAAALALRLDAEEWTGIWQAATGHEVA